MLSMCVFSLLTRVKRMKLNLATILSWQTLETELHIHPFWWPTDVYPPSNQSRLFELFRTLWNENSNSFDTEIPPSANCIHLPISERGDSKVFILICFIWCPVWFVANAKYFCEFLDWSSDVAGWLVISSCKTSVWLEQKLV